MAAYLKRFLAMVIAVSLCLGAAPSAFALTQTETETDTKTEGGITSTVTTTTETVVEGDKTSLNITIETQKDGVNPEGEEVDYDETSKDNTEYTYTEDGTVVKNEWSVDGKEKVTSNKAPDVTADVPLTDEDDPETEETENKNTVTDGGETGSYEDTDNIPEDEKTGNNSDTTRTTVEQQGKVTIETTDVVITESQTSDTELDHVSSETKVIQGGENDNSLLYWDFRNGYKALSGLLEAIENDRIAMENGDENANTAGITPSEGYAYVYIGSDITSQYLPTYLYTTPSPDFPEEEPYMINGVPYYMRKAHPKNSTSTTFDHIFQRNEETGEMERIEVDENSQATTTFSVPQQFLLYDPVKKEVITTYCADVETLNESLFSYNMENLEDATYYSDAEAAMIRAVALNGYWGTSAGIGSLDNLKEALAKEGFTEEELALLNDGMAIAATQMAIWEFSNKSSNLKFFNSQYTKEPGEDGSLYTYWAGSLLDGSAPSEGREAEMETLFKVYNWLISLDPVMANNDPNNPNKTLEDTLVNAKNFIENMSITVIDKAEDHENNKDEDDTNDAYVTDITFALVVKPTEAKEGEEAPEDDLVVQIIGKNGGKEEVIATGRIVGEPQEGEIVLVPDENGNYTFSGITLVEGAHNVTISLSDVQHLKEGVYIYTSEVVDDVTSQTLVALASGAHNIDVSMDLAFELDVDDKIIVRERVWHDEGEDIDFLPQPPEPPERTPPEDPTYIPDEPTPLNDNPNPPEEQYDVPETETIVDEEVPLADVPGLGDDSAIWMLVAAFAVFSLVVINSPEKKRGED